MESRFQKRLGLAEDQMKALHEIHERHAQEARTVQHQLRQAQRTLRQLALTGGDDAAIQAKTAEITKLLAQRLALRVQMLREMASVLTPEQREKLAHMPGASGMPAGAHHHLTS